MPLREITITLMYDDADGVWAECCNGYSENVHAGIDEISELCNLYAVALNEMKELTAETA